MKKNSDHFVLLFSSVDTFLIVLKASHSNKQVGILVALISGEMKNRSEHGHLSTRRKGLWKARDLVLGSEK
jgi:hypothetical protein